MSAEIIVARFRRLLLSATVVIFSLTPLELVLARHYDTAVKLIPFVLCALGLLAALAAWLHPRRQTLLLLRGVMLVIMLGSVLGSFEHLSGNLEFALETHPAAPLSVLLVTTLQGASPLLAPGILALAAVLGIAATHAHPALAPGSLKRVGALAVSSR
jgi:hypothetical protein